MEYAEILQKSGLTPPQAEVYEALLKHGEHAAGSLTKLTNLKRGLVYKVLEDLEGLGLVEKEEPEGKVARFRPKHPVHLRELVESRQKALKDAELVLEGVMPSLASSFNLISGTPGVLVYEGREGIEKVLADSLTATEEILTFADVEAIVKYIDRENQAYVKKREKLDIQKRGIVLDTPYNREYLKDYHRLVTELRFIPLPEAKGFESVMMIYDNKISYLTLTEKRKIGVIIDDPKLYLLHKALFEHLWRGLGSRSGDDKAPVEEKENPEKGGMLNPSFH